MSGYLLNASRIYMYIYNFVVGPKREFKYFKSTSIFVFFKCIYWFSSDMRICFLFVAFVGEHIWHKALLMVYSMKLELFRDCSLNA